MVPAPESLIVARATPPGRGALALVRLTGIGAVGVAARLAGRDTLQPRVATVVTLTLPGGLHESAVVTAFPAPHSYTGQDLAEFSTHGSPVVVDAVVRACLAAGASLAGPGEFTWRAHLNGKLDLVQAEAVADLVAATTPAQVRVASAHLSGALSASIVAMGDELAQLRALLEASLDFPDEGFHFVERENLRSRIAEVRERCEAMLRSADAGRRLHDGAVVVIAGAPNAGKSTLFNALLGRPRAIVTPLAGTTRDLLTDVAEFGGVPVTLVDTAGLRAAVDEVEREGVARAEASVASADLVVLVVDPESDAATLEGSRRRWEELAPDRRVCVLNKSDRWEGSAVALPIWCGEACVRLSARDGDGLARLQAVIAGRLGRADWEDGTLTRVRHRSLVAACAQALGRAEAVAADGGSEEYVLVDLQEALALLASLRGVETPDEVLASIFATFCIGK